MLIDLSESYKESIEGHITDLEAMAHASVFIDGVSVCKMAGTDKIIIMVDIEQ